MCGLAHRGHSLSTSERDSAVHFAGLTAEGPSSRSLRSVVRTPVQAVCVGSGPGRERGET